MCALRRGLQLRQTKIWRADAEREKQNERSQGQALARQGLNKVDACPGTEASCPSKEGSWESRELANLSRSAVGTRGEGPRGGAPREKEGQWGKATAGGQGSGDPPLAQGEGPPARLGWTAP